MAAGEEQASDVIPFSERDFYLREFRGRTIAISGGPELSLAEKVESAGRALRQSGARVLRLSPRAEGISLAPGVEASVWRSLTRTGEAEIRLDRAAADWFRACAEAVLRLGITKWVWLDPAGGLERDGKRLSFVNHAELKAWLSEAGAPRSSLLSAFDYALEEGIPAINLCRPEGLEDELFTYAGSGTLFTRERYVSVRSLGVDDFDAASDLLTRGSAEGYLAPRGQDQRDRLLAHGFGAFVEGAHLAGIGSLLQHAEKRPAEIAGLYTLTRFLGEGVGAHLVAFAKAQASRRGYPGVFACTTSERVGAFFQRNGFRQVGWQELPSEKWEGHGESYDAGRREALLCFLDD